MVLVVGNLANNANAESAISVEASNLYHALRGNSEWATLDNEKKEQLLRIAGDYIVATYGMDWNSATIALVAIPKLMAEANAELALIANNQPLITNIARGKKRVKVGELEVEYDGDAPSQTEFVLASRKLAPLVTKPVVSGPFFKLTRT